MHAALHMVGREAHQEGHQHDDDHADGPAALGALRGRPAQAQRADDARRAHQDDEEGDEEAHHQGQVVEHHQFSAGPVTGRLVALGLVGEGVLGLARREER